VLGTIPSETFTLTGTTGSGGTTPEPASILLFGSGVLGIAGVLRRRLM
jgi:PEP-CTERM motif